MVTRTVMKVNIVTGGELVAWLEFTDFSTAQCALIKSYSKAYR